MSQPVRSSRPPTGQRLLGDVFEKLNDQKTDVVQELKKLVSPDQKPATSADQGDQGIELPGSKSTDPPKPGSLSGSTPQQQAVKRKAEQEKVQFHRQQVKEWEEQYQQLKEAEAREEQLKKQADERKRQQEIVQLQEEEARAAVLQPPAKPKPGRGTAFLPPEKQVIRPLQGTREISHRPTN